MPALTISKLGRTIRHGDGDLRIVEDFDLVLDPGAVHGVTGPLDSGWRSLLRLIVGLDPATGGEVRLADGLTREDLRQEVVLASALDPLLDGKLDRVTRDLGRLAASRRRRTMPPSGGILRAAAYAPSTGTLSPSERLRVCVALAASLRPSFLLVEVEPKPASAAERRLLVDLIRRTAETGVGIVIGTQDEVLLAAVARSVTILEDGWVLSEGSPGSVLPAAASEARREGLL